LQESLLKWSACEVLFVQGFLFSRLINNNDDNAQDRNISTSM